MNVGEGVEKREPSYTVDGNGNWYSYDTEQYGNSLRYLKKSYHMIQHSILLSIYPETIRIQKDTCTPVLTAALIIIARAWKQPIFFLFGHSTASSEAYCLSEVFSSLGFLEPCASDFLLPLWWPLLILLFWLRF